MRVFLAVPIGMFEEACGGCSLCRLRVSARDGLPRNHVSPSSGGQDGRACGECCSSEKRGPSLESAAVDRARFVCAEAEAQRAKAEEWEGVPQGWTGKVPGWSSSAERVMEAAAPAVWVCADRCAAAGDLGQCLS